MARREAGRDGTGRTSAGTTIPARSALMTIVALWLACAVLVRPGHAFAWKPSLLRPQTGSFALLGPDRGLCGACPLGSASGQVGAGLGPRLPGCSVQVREARTCMASQREASTITRRLLPPCPACGDPALRSRPKVLILEPHTRSPWWSGFGWRFPTWEMWKIQMLSGAEDLLPCVHCLTRAPAWSWRKT